jgi:hypothetical protein
MASPMTARAALADLVVAAPVKVDGAGEAVVFGPTGVAVGELPDPPFPPDALVTVPLLEAPLPLPVGELPVPVAATPELEPDLVPVPAAIAVPLLG